MKHGTIRMQFVRFLPEARYGTEFKLYIYIVPLENQIVTHSFADSFGAAMFTQAKQINSLPAVDRTHQGIPWLERPAGRLRVRSRYPHFGKTQLVHQISST